MRALLIVLTVLVTPAVALAQPAPPAAGSGAPAAEPAPVAAEPAPVAAEPAAAPVPGDPVARPPEPPPGQMPLCRLAEAPTPPPSGQQQPTYHSPMRQSCEDELSRDADWWHNLEERLRKRVHRQAYREVRTNNRHVVMAYAAFWILTVGFVAMMWRRQQGLKAEIARLERELHQAIATDGGHGGDESGGDA